MNLMTKGIGTLVSLLAGLAGAKIISVLWRKTTGEEPPTPANPEVQKYASLGTVLAFALVSGASAACIQAVTKRWTGKLGQPGNRA